RSELDSALFAATRDALIESVREAQARPQRLEPLTLAWIPVANATCSVWPGRADEVYHFLAKPASLWPTYLQYICVLGFPERDRFLRTSTKSPILLWDRYDSDHRLAWTNDDVSTLSAPLATDRIHTHLRAAAKWAAKSTYVVEATAIAELFD